MDVDCFGQDSRCLLDVSKYVCSSLTKVSLETRIRESVISDCLETAKKVKLIYMATLKALYEYHNESGSNICYLIKK